MKFVVPIMLVVTLVSFGVPVSANDAKSLPDAPISVPMKPTDSRQNNAALPASATHPKFRRRIEIGSFFRASSVERVTFSPDSRYLAVGVSGSADIYIWDLQRNEQQSHFKVDHLADELQGGPDSMHWRREEQIRWSPDGRFVTTGIGSTLQHGKFPKLPIQFWDPLTGALLHTLDVSAWDSADFNGDGSKLLIASHGATFSVYDTRTWIGSEPAGQLYKFDTGMPATEGYGWTADNKVLMVGSWSGPLRGQPLPAFELGKTPQKFSKLIQKIDPTGKEPTEITVLSPPRPTNDPRDPFDLPFMCHAMVTNHASHKAALRCDGVDGYLIRLLDTQTLQTLFVHREEQSSWIDGANWGLAFSPDGQYLYLLAHNIEDKEVPSKILDTSTGEVVATFPSAYSWGLSISPDGKTMAVGHLQYVELFDLQ
jgi:DNA-binding beta-propeller fold protein YncE